MIWIAAAAACLAFGSTPDHELTDEAYLGEITRHLYRWTLDEDDVRSEINRGEFVYWIRSEQPTLDDGDRSRFAEIILPRVGVRVAVKKADYEIPELGIDVENERYMIRSVTRSEPNDGPVPDGYTEVRLDYEEMKDRLFRTRSQLKPPTGALLDRLRAAARDKTIRRLEERGQPFPTEPFAIHLSPVSPVANEAWVFWEGGDLLYRFHADIDLGDPAAWDLQDLAVEVFDLNQQVVVSLDEVPGSNAYVTRDMVGRVLYNCVVLGERVEIRPIPPETPEQPG